MPNFGSSQQVSGRAGSFCKMGGGQRLNLWTVGYGGVGNQRNSAETVVVTGCAPTAPGLGKGTGPNEAPAFQPMFGSARQRFYGNFSVTVQAVDGTDTPISGAELELMDSREDIKYGWGLSDGSGNITFTVPYNSVSWQVTGYQVGSPDIAGVTRDDLVATWNGN
jgi:hypothetical protein